ncbi:NAD-P-binding protein [Trametes cingulata]|nr:NAD-P-binding protein [Trametes cingulata]
MSSKQLILVTGINGFLGAHIVDQLVKAGYRVRGTVRSSKLALARESNALYGADVEVIAADDLAFGDFTAALKDVHGVIHAAAPLVGADTPENALTAAIEGATNILRQAEKVGVKRYVLVSSAITVGNPEKTSNTPWKETSWYEVTREEALEKRDPGLVYAAEKTLAERAVWEFAEKHPNIDVTALDPPVFIGPFAPNFRFTDALLKELSTNITLHSLLTPTGKFFHPFLPLIDTRDVARALVHALTAPGGAEVGRKRLLILPHCVSWKEVAELVAKERPELKDRLSQPAFTEYPHPAPPNPGADVTKKTVELLKLAELTDWKKSILEGVDSLVEAEKKFAKEGKTFH